MRRVLALAVAALAMAAPAGADVVVKGRIGDVFIGIDTRDFRDRHHRHALRRSIVPPPRIRGAPLVAHPGPFEDLDRERRALGRHAPLPHKRHLRPRFGHHLPVMPYAVPYHYREREDPYVEPPPPPPPPAPEPQAAPEPPPPPDARGPQWETARGRTSALEAAIAVGRPLPRGVPHVTLDWQDYDLPRPPRGQTYARVGTTVLLIETDSRIVRQVL